MDILRRGRAQGKTHNLVKWMLDKPGERGVIVTNAAQRDFFLGELYSVMTEREMEKDQPLFNSIHWPSLVVRPVPPYWHSRTTGVAEWAVDNLDLMLRDLFGVQPVVVTTTEPFENVETL